MGVENLSRISEWGPQDFSQVGPMEIALILVLGFALTRPMATPPARAALVAGLLAMALQHARHAQLLGLVAPMLLARPIAEAIGAARAREAWPDVARVALTASLAMALAIRRAADGRADRPHRWTCRADLGARRRSRRARGRSRSSTATASAAISSGRASGRSSTGEPTCTATPCSGAIASLWPAIQPPSRKRLSRYRIAWTIFAPDDPIVAVLDRAPGWRRLYADGVAVVHVRDRALRSAPGS